MTGKQIEAQAAQPTIYPATTWQQYLLDEATHPDCTDDLRDRFILSNAFLVQPKVDLRRLRRAVEKLRERHDSLRIRLCQIKGKWRAVIDPPHGETIHEIPPVSLRGFGDKLIDSTGAGDQYAAGVLAARALGLSWPDAGRLGSLCATEVITHYGARPEVSIHDLMVRGVG